MALRGSGVVVFDKGRGVRGLDANEACWAPLRIGQSRVVGRVDGLLENALGGEVKGARKPASGSAPVRDVLSLGKQERGRVSEVAQAYVAKSRCGGGGAGLQPYVSVAVLVVLHAPVRGVVAIGPKLAHAQLGRRVHRADKLPDVLSAVSLAVVEPEAVKANVFSQKVEPLARRRQKHTHTKIKTSRE